MGKLKGPPYNFLSHEFSILNNLLCWMHQSLARASSGLELVSICGRYTRPDNTMYFSLIDAMKQHTYKCACDTQVGGAFSAWDNF